MTRKEKIEYLAKAVMTLSQLGDGNADKREGFVVGAEWGAEQKVIEIFKKQNCRGCGTQRCTGEDEWLEGCREFQKWRAAYLKK